MRSSSQVFSKKAQISIQGELLAVVTYESHEITSDAVLVHGFTGSKEDFTEIAVLLAQRGFRVLTFDNRGQNESSSTLRSDGYSMQSLARDVIELANYFGLKQPHLMGHSFGGLISQQSVALKPELWSSLTLFCSGPGGKADWFDDPQFDGLTNSNKTEKWQIHLDKAARGHKNYVLLKKRWSDSDAISTLTFREHLRTFVSLIGKISESGIPSHVVFGENDDVWPLEEQRAMAKILGARISVLPHCAHCPNEENPELTAEVLAQFWESID